MQRYGPWRCRLLAEKVETREEFFAARKARFLFFQGYFFRQPEVLTSAREIPTNHVHYVRMLQAVSRKELDHREIEALIKSEASLCYRLLRYMNSAVSASSNEIHSVTACPVVAGRARGTALGAPGGDSGRGLGKIQRIGFSGSGARTLLRATVAQDSARRVGLISHGIVFVDGYDSGDRRCPTCWPVFRWIRRPKRYF